MLKLLWKHLPFGLTRVFFAEDAGGEPAGGEPGGGEPGGGGSFDTGGEGNYYDAMDMVKGNPDALAYAKKYKSAEEAIIGGHNAEKKIGSSFRLPEDTTNLTDEQKGELLGYIKQFRDVPETADGYEITHAEGTVVNEDLENSLRAFAKERSWGNKDVQQLVDWWDTTVNAMKGKIQQAEEKAFVEADQNFRIQSGGDYEKKMEGIKRLRAAATKELGLGYVNDKGEPDSKLDDALRTKDANGHALGNQVPILQLLSWIHENFLAEGEPVEASGGVGGVGGDFFKYKTVDK